MKLFANFKINLYKEEQTKKKKKKKRILFSISWKSQQWKLQPHKQETSNEYPHRNWENSSLERLQNWLRHFHSRKCSSINRTMRVYIAACTSRSTGISTETGIMGFESSLPGSRVSSSCLKLPGRFRADREIEANQGYNRVRATNGSTTWKVDSTCALWLFIVLKIISSRREFIFIYTRRNNVQLIMNYLRLFPYKFVQFKYHALHPTCSKFWNSNFLININCFWNCNPVINTKQPIHNVFLNILNTHNDYYSVLMISMIYNHHVGIKCI